MKWGSSEGGKGGTLFFPPAAGNDRKTRVEKKKKGT